MQCSTTSSVAETNTLGREQHMFCFHSKTLRFGTRSKKTSQL